MDPSPPSGPTNSPESTLSSDSSLDRIAKKTRDLPNLSDCHSCGHRINYSNPKERLQPMDSMWRIVLLCKKCSKKVKSSDLCPYCFSCTSGGDDCFKCRDCDRCIHRDCVGKYGGIAPWSYSCSGLGFSVCIDCWVPDSLVSSIRVYKRKSRKKRRDINKNVVSDTAALDNNDLEEAVKNANMLVERKVVNAVRAKENVVRKAVAAKGAVELATGAVNFVSQEDEKGKCIVGGGDHKENKVVGDAELAIMLHRAMNSSARILRNKLLGSASKLVVLDNGDDTLGGITEKLGRTVSETSVCFKSSDCGSFVDSSDRMMNGNTSSTRNECQASGQGRCEGNTDRYLLKYQRIDKSVAKPSLLSNASGFGPCSEPIDLNNGTVTDTKPPLNDNRWLVNGEQQCNEKGDRYLLKYARSRMNGNKDQKNTEESCDEKPNRYFLTFLNGGECQGNGDGRYNEKSDRFLLKYRRNYRTGIRCDRNQEGFREKPDCSFLKYMRTSLNRNHSQGNGEESCDEKPDRYSLKYAKRSKSSDPPLNGETNPLYDSFYHGNRNSTPL